MDVVTECPTTAEATARNNIGDATEDDFVSKPEMSDVINISTASVDTDVAGTMMAANPCLYDSTERCRC